MLAVTQPGDRKVVKFDGLFYGSPYM